MISVIVPTYRNSKCLDLCLKSIMENKVLDETEVIVVVDGYPEESAEVIAKYKGLKVLNLPENKGMGYALNLGVMNASNPYICIVNDDNIFPREYDRKFQEAIWKVAEQSWAGFDIDSGELTEPENICIQINQVERSEGIFDYVVKDLGGPDDFRYEEWLDYEPTVSQELATPNGRLFPFILSKKWYMVVGGFDNFFNSPFWVDCDFFLKLELINKIQFVRWHGCHLYHFGRVSTMNRKDAESEIFIKSEGEAAQIFLYKWNFIPSIVEAAKLRNNSKLPLDKEIKGIRFN